MMTALPGAIVAGALGLLTLPDFTWTGVVFLAHAASFWLAARTGRPRWTVVLWIGTVLNLALLWAQATVLWRVEEYPALLVGSVLGALADQGRGGWRTLFRAVTRPRSALAGLLGVVAIVSLGCWWQGAAHLRFEVYRAAGWRVAEEQLTLEYLEGQPPPESLRDLEIVCGMLWPDRAEEVYGILADCRSWPWLTCVPADRYVAWEPRTRDFGGGGVSRYGPQCDLLSMEFSRSAGSRGAVKVEDPSSPGTKCFATPFDCWIYLDQAADRGFLDAKQTTWDAETIWPCIRDLLEGGASADSPELLTGWLDGLRLGHLPIVRLTSWEEATIECAFCGRITGPAHGVSERADGSLEWGDSKGAVQRTGPVTWFLTRPPAGPRPTMEGPR